MNQAEQQFLTYLERNLWTAADKLRQQFQSPRCGYYMAPEDCPDGCAAAPAIGLIAHVCDTNFRQASYKDQTFDFLKSVVDDAMFEISDHFARLDEPAVG